MFLDDVDSYQQETKRFYTVDLSFRQLTSNAGADSPALP